MIVHVEAPSCQIPGVFLPLGLIREPPFRNELTGIEILSNRIIFWIIPGNIGMVVVFVHGSGGSDVLGGVGILFGERVDIL